ncbi:MAG TPA: phage tail sheath C-terminal domain-containing protein [Acidimicrobiia bacterium]|nr:phage tail sheath C-terminal domain-containing protein [Acidimicrobiia bacterium]
MPTYLTPGVYVEEVDTGSKPLSAVGTAVAAFVGFTAKAPLDDPDDPDGLRPRLVTNWSQFERLYGGFAPGAMLPHAVYGYFNNGGGLCYIVRVAHEKPTGERPALALPTAEKPDKPALELTAKVEDDIEVVIQPGIPDPESGGEGPAFELIVLRSGTEAERFGGLSMTKGPRFAEAVVNETSTLINIKVKTTEKSVVPATGTFAVERAATAPVPVRAGDFEGAESNRTGIRGLVIADEVTMIAIPDLVTAARQDDGTVDLDMWKSVQTSLITHCEGAANRMAILDPPPGLDSQQVKEWRAGEAMYDSKFAALYYPWIKVANPAGTNGDRFLTVPPSGHLAGVWARNDESRGVWKAPANEVIFGALDVANKVTEGEQSLLNPIGVNCIRPFSTRGIRVWGARTLSSDPSWRYLNVRRLFNMIETSILQGTQWVVFEPNDMALWARVRRTITAFLLGLWRDGALFGATPEEAFYVKCDAETNPPESIDEGKLVVEVGIAPVKPAEFVIFRVSQWHGGASVE